MSPNCHESIVESSIELEQEYKMCTGEDIAIFQPTIDVKDVELDKFRVIAYKSKDTLLDCTD